MGVWKYEKRNTVMKKLLFVAMMLAAGICLAAENDTILTFSTQGPDTYGDGTTVLDGERYALVWTKDGTAFAGLTADCRPLADTTKVIAVAPLAKDGRCPETVFEIDAGYAETLSGGSFALYLLDTRVAKDELSGAAGVRALPTSVNSTGVVAPASELAGSESFAPVKAGSGSFASVKAGAVSLAAVGVYTKIEEPRIEAMKVAGAKIELTVSGMSGAAEYMVVQGAEPGKVGAKMETTVQGDKLTVDKPAGGAMFFKVIGVRSFK